MSVTDQIAARELNRYKPVPQYSALTSSTINYPLNKEGQGMDGLRDNMGDVVDLNEVMTKWLSTVEAAESLGYSRQYITQILIARKRIRAYKHGTERRGEWYVDPQSVEAYKQSKL
jgi:excisionase family DNA binding protein